MKQATANQLSALINTYRAHLLACDSTAAEMTAHSIQHKYTRNEVRPAVLIELCRERGIALNEAGNIVKPTGKSAAVLARWEADRKAVQRAVNKLVAPIYQPKPKATATNRNKVDPLEAEAKRLRGKFTPAQLRRLFDSLGVK